MITLEQVRESLPATLKKAATDSLVDLINNVTNDPLVAEEIRNNFVSYTSVLKDGKFRTEDYLSAVAYVSFKLRGDTNKEAWAKTFPQRYATLVAKAASEKDISAHVSAYNKGQLVNKILEQSLVPSWVLNQDVHQKAINHLAFLMINAQSEKVQSDSANALLTHLKKPEGKIEVDLNVKDNSGMDDMKRALADMAATQRELIANGIGIKTITDSKIIENDDVGTS